MTTQQILELDFREEESKKIIQKVLRQIKPLSKYSVEQDIPLDAIEKALRVMQVKYNFRIRSIYSDVYANDKEVIYRAEVVNEKDLKSFGNVYGISIYELFAKICIKLYAIVKQGNVELRK